jgi:hypothetical protein
VLKVLSGPREAFLTCGAGNADLPLTPPHLPGRRMHENAAVGGASAGASSSAVVGADGGATGRSGLVSPVLPPATGPEATGPVRGQGTGSDGTSGEGTPQAVGSKRAHPPV